MDSQQVLRIGWRLQKDQTEPFTDPSPTPTDLMNRLCRMAPLLRNLVRDHNSLEIACPADPNTIERMALPDWTQVLDPGVRGELYGILSMGSVQFAVARLFLCSIRELVIGTAADYADAQGLTLADIANLYVPIVLLDPARVILQSSGQPDCLKIGLFTKVSRDAKIGWRILVSRFPQTLAFSDWANNRLIKLIHDAVTEQVLDAHMSHGPAN